MGVWATCICVPHNFLTRPPHPRPEEDLGCPGTIVRDCCDDVQIEAGSSGKAVSAPYLWAIFPAASKFSYNQLVLEKCILILRFELIVCGKNFLCA